MQSAVAQVSRIHRRRDFDAGHRHLRKRRRLRCHERAERPILCPLKCASGAEPLCRRARQRQGYGSVLSHLSRSLDLRDRNRSFCSDASKG